MGYGIFSRTIGTWKCEFKRYYMVVSRLTSISFTKIRLGALRKAVKLLDKEVPEFVFLSQEIGTMFADSVKNGKQMKQIPIIDEDPTGKDVSASLFVRFGIPTIRSTRSATLNSLLPPIAARGHNRLPPAPLPEAHRNSSDNERVHEPPPGSPSSRRYAEWQAEMAQMLQDEDDLVVERTDAMYAREAARRAQNNKAKVVESIGGIGADELENMFHLEEDLETEQAAHATAIGPEPVYEKRKVRLSLSRLRILVLICLICSHPSGLSEPCQVKLKK